MANIRDAIDWSDREVEYISMRPKAEYDRESKDERGRAVPTGRQERDPDTGMPVWQVTVSEYEAGVPDGTQLRVNVAMEREPEIPKGVRHPLVEFEDLKVRLWGVGQNTGHALYASGMSFKEDE